MVRKINKKLKCFHCREKGNKNDMIREEVKRQSGISYRFYHSHCYSIKNIRDFDKHRLKIGKNESREHKKLKEDILKGLLGKQIKFVDQFKSKHSFYGEYMSTEIPISYDNVIPYLHSGTCQSCFSKFEVTEVVDDEWINKDILMQSIPIVKETNRLNKSKDTVCLKAHPCVSCKFNSNDFKLIFDIGIVNKGKIDTVIEILNTSKVKREKLLYCIKNNIKLFEVNVKCNEDVSVYCLNEVKCEMLWWKENGKIKIADRYKI